MGITPMTSIDASGSAPGASSSEAPMAPCDRRSHGCARGPHLHRFRCAPCRMSREWARALRQPRSRDLQSEPGPPRRGPLRRSGRHDGSYLSSRASQGSAVLDPHVARSRDLQRCRNGLGERSRGCDGKSTTDLARHVAGVPPRLGVLVRPISGRPIRRARRASWRRFRVTCAPCWLWPIQLHGGPHDCLCRTGLVTRRHFGGSVTWHPFAPG